MPCCLAYIVYDAWNAHTEHPNHNRTIPRCSGWVSGVLRQVETLTKAMRIICRNPWDGSVPHHNRTRIFLSFLLFNEKEVSYECSNTKLILYWKQFGCWFKTRQDLMQSILCLEILNKIQNLVKTYKDFLLSVCIKFQKLKGMICSR